MSQENDERPQRPIPGVMYGLTHAEDGSLIIREPKILKVGIGMPRGPAISVWTRLETDKSVSWNVTIGYKKADAQNAKPNEIRKTITVKNKADAERVYRENVDKAPVCSYPRKLPYFMFSKPTMTAGGTELFEPDFDAIEAYGPTPTEIDILFLDNNPFHGEFQMWSSSELKCHGDGITALRVCSMAKTPEHKLLAQQALEQGSKYFPIIDGCWTKGCEFTKEPAPNKPTPCKPGADLKFQLARGIRIGGTAYFHSSGIRSIMNLNAALHQFAIITKDRLAGLIVKMVLRPYKTNHNGQAATQYGVALEFRARDIEALTASLQKQTMDFTRLMTGESPKLAVRLLEKAGAAEGLGETIDTNPITGATAGAMAGEFYVDATGATAFDDEVDTEADDDHADPAVTDAETGHAQDEATEQKTPAQDSSNAGAANTEASAGLSDKLRAARQTQENRKPQSTPVEAKPEAAKTEPAKESEQPKSTAEPKVDGKTKLPGDAF